MAEHKSIWTAANIVTTIRMLLVPVFVVLLLTPWPEWVPFWSQANDLKPWVAAIFFTIIAATDGVDGYLARSRNEVTTLGKFLDPLADKILVCAALLCLIDLGALPSWIAMIIIAREFIISGLRMVASAEGVVIAASWYGKWKTFITIIAIILFIVKDSTAVATASFYSLFNTISWLFMAAAVILTIVSMVDYFAKASDTLTLFKGNSEEGTESTTHTKSDDYD